MKKLLIIWLLTLTVIILSSCRKDINGPNNVINDQQNNWVAVTGYFVNNGVHSTNYKKWGQVLKYYILYCIIGIRSCLKIRLWRKIL